MATRYSKRRTDGTIGYYDSVEAMNADVPDRPELFDFSGFYAVIGCFVFFVAACFAMFFGAGDALPKWARFASVFAVASIGYYVIGYIGELLFRVFMVLFLVAVVGGVLTLIWHFV